MKKDTVSEQWRGEVKRLWPLRKQPWEKEQMQHFLALIRLREDRNPDKYIRRVYEERKASHEK